MELGTFSRAVEINERLKKLYELKKEIESKGCRYRLSFLFRRFGCESVWKECSCMPFIQGILKDHEIMIREEIDDRIKQLNKEIEEL